MSSSLRRGALAATAFAFSIASLAACGAGDNAQTLQIKPDNAATSVGAIKIQNALVITQPDPEAEGPAVVSATLFNSGDSDQTVDAIKLPNVNQTAEVKAAKGNGKVVVPAHGSVVIGGKGNASATLVNGQEAVQSGSVRKVTFTFSETGDVSLSAYVVPAKSYFSEWGPSEIPTPTATPSASPTGSATPSGSASPSGSPSGSPAAGEGSASPSASAS